MLEYINKNKAYVKGLQEQLGIQPTGVVDQFTLDEASRQWKNPVISHNGRLVPIKFNGQIKHHYSLHKLPDCTQNWSERKQPIENIVVHQNGLNAPNAFQNFFAPKYTHLSTHFLIGYDPNCGEIHVFQLLDTHQVAIHSGKVNKHSVSVDVCQSMSVKQFAKTKGFYKGAEVVKNDSKRGDSEIIDIDPELAKVANEFLRALNEALCLNYKPVCKTDEVFNLEEAQEYSIISNSNVSVQKTGITPWSEKLFAGL